MFIILSKQSKIKTYVSSCTFFLLTIFSEVYAEPLAICKIYNGCICQETEIYQSSIIKIEIRCENNNTLPFTGLIE